MLSSLRSKIPNGVRSFENRYWLNRLGVDFNFYGSKNNEGNPHMPLPFLIFKYALISSGIRKEFRNADIVIDIGSGTGKLLWMISRETKSFLLGIENEEVLCTMSQKNLEKLDVKATVKYADVLDFDFAQFRNKKTILTLFNPLPGDLLAILLEKIVESQLQFKMIFFWDADELSNLNRSPFEKIWRSKLIKSSIWKVQLR